MVSGSSQSLSALSERVSVRVIGAVRGEELSIRVAGGAGETGLRLTLDELQAAYSEGLADFFA